MKLSSALVFVALATMTPLAVLAACGNATFSATELDAGPVDDASVAPAPDSPSGTWCQVNAPSALACADFDEGNSGDVHTGYLKNLQTQLFVESVGDDGGLQLVGNGSSVPNALAARIADVAPSSRDRDTLSVVLVGSNAEAFTFGTMLRFDDATVQSTLADPLNVCSLLLGRPGDAGIQPVISVALQIFGGKLHLDVSNGVGNQVTLQLGPLSPTEEWTAFSVNVITGSPGTITASFGSVVASGPIDLQPGVATLVLGLDSPSPTGDTRATAISYDNVTFTTADGG